MYNRRGRYGRRRTYSQRPYNRRYYRKRTKKRKPPAASKVIVRGPWIMPDTLFTKLPYTETFNLSAVSYNDSIFRGNSIYDPYFSGAGHQPLAYDQLTALYNMYTVMGCKATLTVIPTSSGVSQSDVQMSILASNDSGGLISYDLVSETPYNKTKYVGNASTGPKTISSFYRTSKILGVSKRKIMDDDQFSAVYNTNPAHNYYIHFFIADLTGDLLTCTFKVKLVYYVRFYDRIKLTAS